MQTDQRYEVIEVSKVQEHPANPRVGGVEVIKNSIARNGFYGAIVVQKSTGYVLAGNHRLRAARDAGMDTIPAIVLDCDDTTARRILLADNRTSDLAGYDDQALADLLQAITMDAGDTDALLGTGYGIEDLDTLLNTLEAEAADDTGPDLGAGGATGAPLPHLKWNTQRIPLSADDVSTLDRLLGEYIEEHGSQYGFLRYMLEERHIMDGENG